MTRTARSAASMLFVAACLATAAMLSGCNTLIPEAKVVTQRVEVPVAVKCAADPGPAPTYADTPEALKAAPDVFEREKLVVATEKQLRAYVATLEAANAGCR